MTPAEADPVLKIKKFRIYSLMNAKMMVQYPSYKKSEERLVQKRRDDHMIMGYRE